MDMVFIVIVEGENFDVRGRRGIGGGFAHKAVELVVGVLLGYGLAIVLDLLDVARRKLDRSCNLRPPRFNGRSVRFSHFHHMNSFGAFKIIDKRTLSDKK